MIKIIRSTTVPSSLDTFCKGLLKDLSQEYEVIGLSSPGESLDKVGIREGIRTISIPMERRISPFKDINSLLLLIRTFYKEKPYIVHSMTPKAGLLCMLASWVCRVPVRIHTFTGLVFPTAKGLSKKILMLTDWLTCACATHIIPEGEGVKNDLLNHGITRKNIKVLGYGNVRGIDLKHYDRSPEVMEKANTIRNPESFSFIFIGRIVKDKGINELIEAFSRLSKENDKIWLILVGPYEDGFNPISDKTRHEIEVNNRIITVGRQNDVRHWLASCDALVFPSYREGFPNVVIEAGALGLPSIVTDINGSREIIQEGINGVIIPPHDTDSLYFAMKRFTKEPDFVATLSKKARQMVASRYEQGFVRKCLINFYSEILTKTDQIKCTH
ncbi:glycosyltransferase family 4 protein [Macellibacteroides fermentans]|uniref:Glycosyltransferase involved in cell wall biosynthesis n=1 Tax=Macellibacteroides fermentans TaxID=879969 RepID=A0A8E1ZYE9_9PORP|nr:glycosyltransferase family 4 protein [Macellibacteroides fermentans]NYI50807.1 glycosyltransferase involved in cell wall biosynthesis [Macellibacteroides fermentans]